MKRAFIFFVIIGILLSLTPLVFVSCENSKSERMERQVNLKLYVHHSGEVVSIPLEEYVAGVVAAEMPASFHLEALKAQAVLARTYAYRKLAESGTLHPGAHLCDDPAHGQAYLDESSLRQRWGPSYRHWWVKVLEAVRSTSGEIVTFEGQPIDPVYHAASGGRTEDACYVWGNAVPYLVSVTSPERQEVPAVRDETFIPAEELKRVAGADGPVEVLRRSPTGRVLEVRVGKNTIDGQEFRRLFGLRSTLFDIERVSGGWVVRTRGYGHGVGLSQYGADAMAEGGYDYRQIIGHYYSGAVVSRSGKE